jgi:hypothetical protein
VTSGRSLALFFVVVEVEACLTTSSEWACENGMNTVECGIDATQDD